MLNVLMCLLARDETYTRCSRRAKAASTSLPLKRRPRTSRRSLPSRLMLRRRTCETNTPPLAGAHSLLALPQGDPHHLAGLAVGEDKHALVTIQPPKCWQHVLYQGVAKIVHVLVGTFERGYPCEHAITSSLCAGCLPRLAHHYGACDFTKPAFRSLYIEPPKREYSPKFSLEARSIVA